MRLGICIAAVGLAALTVAAGAAPVGAWQPQGEVVIAKSSSTLDHTRWSLVVATARGNRCRELFVLPRGSEAPHVSPDGRRIAYRVAADMSTPGDLVVAGIDGSARRVIAQNVRSLQGWLNNRELAYSEQLGAKRQRGPSRGLMNRL